MLKFARRRSSSTDREPMRKVGRSSGGDAVLMTPKQRSSSAERTAVVVTPTGGTPVTSILHLESPTKVECRTASTACVRRLDADKAGTTSSPMTVQRNSLTRPNFAPMTSTLSQLSTVMSEMQIVEAGGQVPTATASTTANATTTTTTIDGSPSTIDALHQQRSHSKSVVAGAMLPPAPPPVLPRKPKLDNFLTQAPMVGHPHNNVHHHSQSAHLWKIELLDTSGESGYGTDSSDNNSLRSQESTTEPSPPPLPKRKPRRRVQFDSYVLLIQSLKDRDLKGILSTIFNVSAEALCTEDVIYHFHTAILRQDYEVTDLLVRAGCEVNTFDHRGWSALHCACSVARLDIIKLLLQNGAAVLARTHHTSQTGSQLLPPDNPAFTQCLAYLRCMEECLGTVNSRLVMAAANYRASRIDELTIGKGDRLVVLRRGDTNNEMWWWVRNGRAEEGYVLRDLLALNSRHS